MTSREPYESTPPAFLRSAGGGDQAEPTLRTWLLRAADHPAEAVEQWARHGVALLRTGPVCHAYTTTTTVGRCVVDALGDDAGPVIQDARRAMITVLVPPGSVVLSGTVPLVGSVHADAHPMLVPRPEGGRGLDGVTWLVRPKEVGRLTDIGTLGAAIRSAVDVVTAWLPEGQAEAVRALVWRSAKVNGWLGGGW